MPKQVALVVDVLLICLFALIGVMSHKESIAARWPIAVWPFLVACLVAWAILLLRKRSVATLSAGVFVWLVTAWGGLCLRVASGGGFQISFGIVATVFTGLFLVGWRALLGRRIEG